MPEIKPAFVRVFLWLDYGVNQLDANTLITFLTLLSVVAIALLGALWARINSIYDNYNGFKEQVGKEYMPREECERLIAREISGLKEQITKIENLTTEIFKQVTHKEPL